MLRGSGSRGHIFLRLALATTLAFVQSNSNAFVTHSIEITCPIDGEKFLAEETASHTLAGQFLDMKPFGATIAPPPVPKCPTSGFLIYKESYSDAEIQTLKEYVSSNQWRRLKGRNTDYYLIAKLRAHLGETPDQLKFVLLQATWEARSKQMYRQYATEALAAYSEALKEDYVDRQQWLTDQFVAGELERRLRMFHRAQARFTLLSEHKESRTGAFQRILELQLKLIKVRDAEPNKIE
jgi:hypothetical protein